MLRIVEKSIVEQDIILSIDFRVRISPVECTLGDLEIAKEV
jgi:hypothetical protein